MKITPLEIRQKTFEKTFRGHDKDEVNAFLHTLSQVWEKILDENKELKIKLEASENEVEKLREVESSLFKTLKTAEDTGANLIDQANKTAELHLKETQLKAEVLLNDTKNKAKEIMKEAEDTAKKALDNMDVELKALVQVYKNLQNLRDNLMDDLKNLANDTMDKVNRVKEKKKKFDVDEYLKDLISKSSVPFQEKVPQKSESEEKTKAMENQQEDTFKSSQNVTQKDQETPQQKDKSGDPKPDFKGTSFFDEI